MYDNIVGVLNKSVAWQSADDTHNGGVTKIKKKVLLYKFRLRSALVLLDIQKKASILLNMVQ
jgi:hypothetical protein